MTKLQDKKEKKFLKHFHKIKRTKIFNKARKIKIGLKKIKIKQVLRKKIFKVNLTILF